MDLPMNLLQPDLLPDRFSLLAHSLDQYCGLGEGSKAPHVLPCVNDPVPPWDPPIPHTGIIPHLTSTPPIPFPYLR